MTAVPFAPLRSSRPPLSGTEALVALRPRPGPGQAASEADDAPATCPCGCMGVGGPPSPGARVPRPKAMSRTIRDLQAEGWSMARIRSALELDPQTQAHKPGPKMCRCGRPADPFGCLECGAKRASVWHAEERAEYR